MPFFILQIPNLLRTYPHLQPFFRAQLHLSSWLSPLGCHTGPLHSPSPKSSFPQVISLLHPHLSFIACYTSQTPGGRARHTSHTHYQSVHSPLDATFPTVLRSPHFFFICVVKYWLLGTDCVPCTTYYGSDGAGRVSAKSLQSGGVEPWIWAVTFQGEKCFSRKKSLRLREEPIAPWFLE